MHPISIFCLFIVLSYLGVQLLLLIFSFVKYRRKNEPRPLKGALPKISILVPMRNEEQNVIRCLEGLNKLSYPKDKTEILIANDGSKDHTAELVKEFIKDKPGMRLYNIVSTLGKAKGKANALAQLARRSTGEFIFFTDADILVPKDWIQSLLCHFDDNTGVVTGTTIVDGETLFSKFQGTDWLNFMGMVNRFANAGIPCSGAGNNMAVRRIPYEALGGYENIEFSVTEDTRLFLAIIELGWGWKNILNSKVLNVSNPLPDVKSVFMQRKRWLDGGMELSFGWKILFALLGLFTPALLLLICIDLQLGITLWLLKFFIQSIFLLILAFHTGRTDFIKYIVPYEFYSLVSFFLQVLYFILPFEYKWKGRRYTPGLPSIKF